MMNSGGGSMPPISIPLFKHSLEVVKFRTETAKLTSSFREFAKAAWPILVPSSPLIQHFAFEAICDHLQAVSNNQIKKLIINVPPGLAKSSLVACLWPVWEWTFRPEIQWLFATYANDLTHRDAARRRDIVKDPWYQERWGKKVEITKEGVEFIKNAKQGHMFSTSTGGQTLGWRGDRLVLDDPQDPKGAESDIKRESTIEWLTRTWPTRVNLGSPYAAQVLIQQRLHEKDATGLYLKMGGFVHLKIPLEYKGKVFSTPLYSEPRRTIGQIIDERIYPRAATEELKKTLGPYGEAGQLDQEPAPLGGGIIKRAWIRHWRYSDEKQRSYVSIMDGLYQFDPFQTLRFCVCDPAVSEEELGDKKLTDPDYTSIGVWVAFATKQGPALCLMDKIKERMEGPDIIPRIEALHKHWKFAVIGVETVAFQKILFQQAKRKGLPVREISTKANDGEALYRIDRDKLSRVVAATPLMADPAGRFYVPEYAPWLAEYIDELTKYPVVTHDDDTDMTCMAIPIAEKLMRGQSIYSSDNPESNGSSQKPRDPRQDESSTPDPWQGFLQENGP